MEVFMSGKVGEGDRFAPSEGVPFIREEVKSRPSHEKLLNESKHPLHQEDEPCGSEAPPIAGRKISQLSTEETVARSKNLLDEAERNYQESLKEIDNYSESHPTILPDSNEALELSQLYFKSQSIYFDLVCLKVEHLADQLRDFRSKHDDIQEGTEEAITLQTIRNEYDIASKEMETAYAIRQTLVPRTVPTEESLKEALDATVNFNKYYVTPAHPERIKNGPFMQTGLTTRAANIFYRAIGIEEGPRRRLFEFPGDGEELREQIIQGKDPVVVKATDEELKIGRKVILPDRRESVTWETSTEKAVFGEKEFKISREELKQMLDSQEIFLSPLIPEAFYMGFKEALDKEPHAILPGGASAAGGNSFCLVGDLLKDTRKWPVGDLKHLREFMKKVDQDPIFYGFDRDSYKEFKRLTLYQVGSMVIKREDYRILTDENGQMRERNVGDEDAIRLVNGCGIRMFEETMAYGKEMECREILTNMFKTALAAAEKGIVIFPAVGMGVWKGDPAVYWAAFIEAIRQSDQDFDVIYVNPNHGPTPKENIIFSGSMGEEFQLILDGYLQLPDLTEAQKAKLLKIRNLREGNEGKDIAQLAAQMKKRHPGTIVSLFNASDPDVTLGNHVGEYVNNTPHTYTTEENYTAMGTNGVCFEKITGVRREPWRVHKLYP